MHLFLDRKADPIQYEMEMRITNLFNTVFTKVAPLKIQVTEFSIKFGPDFWWSQH